jgi:hypothetical protein
VILEVYIPGYSVTGSSAGGSGGQKGSAVVQGAIWDGTNQTYIYFNQVPFPTTTATTIGLGPFIQKQRYPSLAAATTFQFQSNYSSTSGLTAGTLEAGTGVGNPVIPPAWIRATTA